MPGVRDALRQWQRRRVALTEEWKFHQHRVMLELVDVGFTELEARAIATERLGPNSRYQKEAFADYGGDWKGLIRLLAPRPVRREAWIVPGAMALALILLIGLNPFHHQVIASMTGIPHFFQEPVTPRSWAEPCIPGHSFLYLADRVGRPDNCVVNAVWVKPWSIPAGFGQVSCLVGMIAGIHWLIARSRVQKHGKAVWVYGVTTLLFGSLLGAVSYATSVQWMLVGPGDTAAKDGLGVVALWFVWGPSFLLLLRQWRKDVLHRCPWCLERLQWPVERGDVDSILLNPTGVESVCLAGHGVQTDAWWGDEFREAGSFWDDLERDQCPGSGLSPSSSGYS